MEYKWRVKKSERGITLENFIYKNLGDWSHKQVKTAIDNKRAFVNGQNVFISKWNLKPDAVVLFVPSDKDQITKTNSRYRFIDVLFEDTYILATNKPAHVDFESYVKTVQDYLVRQNRIKSYPYVGQMHRLDKETTGVMLFTKKKMANSLADQFRDHSLKKYYLALVDGRLKRENGVIKKSVEKGQFESGKKVKVSDSLDSKKATTLYTVVERYRSATLLKIEIKTGRTHQIRVHLSDMGFPVVGDKLYGLQGGIPFRRHALHAERIDFKHPVTSKPMRVTAPVPPDMQRLIDEFRESA
ncbi:MAG: RluA family pseudouridine synthase [Deltaproteobacteria bacterium]|nr:RluA family pseudouridine synthase [Deltaproteobacteria bacterium]